MNTKFALALLTLLPTALAGCAFPLFGTGFSPTAPAGGPHAQPDGNIGLEAVWWMTSAGPSTLWSAFRDVNTAHGQIPEPSRMLWAENGMRVFAIPADRFPAVESALQAGRAPSTQRQRIDQSAVWSEAFRGTARADARTVALDAERLPLGPGALRLLVRTWFVPLHSEPGEPGVPKAGVRIEIVPQLVEARGRSASGDDDPTVRRTKMSPESEGLVFSRLGLGFTARAGWVFVIVPERPGVDWADPDTRPNGNVEVRSVAGRSDAPAAPPDRSNTLGVGAVARGRPASGAADVVQPVGAAIGPAAPKAPTIGEAMLMIDQGGTGSDGSTAARRVVLVLIPRPPEAFRLTPD